jgi:putative transcriptional regulator
MTKLFCMLLALITSFATLAADAKGMTGLLLIARAEMPDSNFREAVVFVTNQSGNAPVGVIINKPSRITVASLFPDIDNLAQLDDRVHFGGPVAPDMLSFLFRADETPAHPGVMEAFPGVHFSTNYNLLVELLRRREPMAGLRIFRGHSRWDPGQLESEIIGNNWTVMPANAGAIFETAPEQLWPDLRGLGTGERASLGRHASPVM